MDCADSSFVIDILKGEPKALRYVEGLRRSGRGVSLPAPVITEVMLGALKRGGTHLTQTLEMLDSLPVLSVDAEAASEAAHIGFRMAHSGQTLDLADLLIAGIAVRHRAMLITRDTDFDTVPGLAVAHY